MAITAKDVEQLKGAALTLLGGIVWRAEPDSIRIREYDGHPANMLWIKVGTKDYAFRYEHKTEQIEIRDGSQKGAVLYQLDDTMTVAGIDTIIRAL